MACSPAINSFSPTAASCKTFFAFDGVFTRPSSRWSVETNSSFMVSASAVAASNTLISS